MAKRESRSARSGKFVTKAYAKRHPAETTTERNTISPRKRSALDAAMSTLYFAMDELGKVIAKL